MEPQSLFYRVYKARYFPTCSFMEAELRLSPSFVWRSLLQARDIIKGGSAWKIGDGCTIGVESHKWLPHPPSFRPGANRSLQVSDLITPDTHQWNRATIQETFNDSTRTEILRIKLGNMQTRYRLCQTENRAHKFIVKSACHVALQLQQPDAAEHSRVGRDRMVWKKLWKLNIPPKVRMFTWRACSDILPTKVNLARKKIQVDPKCTTCTQQDETICHVLWQYSLARNIRALVRGKIQKSSSSAENFFDLTAQMMDRLSKWEL